MQVLKWLSGESDVVLPAMPNAHPVSAVFNREAIIPPQCYTRTEGKYNPCYVCHQNEIPGRENTMNDGDLQEAYSFSDLGMTNRWLNLFEDRSERVKAISDEEILAWISKDNYSDLAPRLRQAGFKGWIPDLQGLQEGAVAFDSHGFARDGSGWVAFNYKPLPSTFWPTNGSTDDVMIRLPDVFRTNKQKRYSRDIYMANLAILEANIKGLAEVTVPPVDERVIGVDLNGDGELAVVEQINRLNDFTGAAEGYFFKPSLYPLGTEFLHTVRYVGTGDNNEIVNSRRIKEVRYMHKQFMMPKFVLDQLYREELYEKEQGYLPGYINRGHQGLDNEMGWVIHGFIENRQGRLRVATFEENLFCMGCHTSIGATIDKTFSFPRKIDGAQGWGYVNLKGMPDVPNAGETKGEILTYLERVGGGGEFRSNEEMARRWLKNDGRVDAKKIAAAKDVYELITPSRERALELNKAYRVIVEDQDYILGRDATVKPPENVYAEVDNQASPTLPPDRIHRWNILLDWSRAD
ncbi:MAG TPA: hypothetical protein VF268_12300 [Gammaproteobacteria bacterium]